MILSPVATFKEDEITIYQFYHPLEKETKPEKIKVFLFNTFKLTSLTSFGEFLCRRMYYNETPKSTFVIDKFNIWQNQPLDKNISIVLCGTESFGLGSKFINFLLKKFKLNKDIIFLNFEDSDFIKKINNVTFNKKELKTFILENLKITPKVTVDIFKKGQWNTDDTDSFIEKIKIKVNIGQIKYRVFTKGKWQNWVNNNEETGIENYYIKGFQFQYIDDNYTLFYQCKINNKYTNLKETCKDKEFKYYIQDIKMELREVNQYE